MVTAYYFDSSALVKRYSAETGAKFMTKLLRPSAKHRCYSAVVTEVEVCAALSRRRKNTFADAANATKSIARFRRNFAARFVKNEVTNLIIAEAVRLTDAHALRGYDAVQLASALTANRIRVNAGIAPLILISADSDLNNAAVREGLTVENPNNYL